MRRSPESTCFNTSCVCFTLQIVRDPQYMTACRNMCSQNFTCKVLHSHQRLPAQKKNGSNDGRQVAPVGCILISSPRAPAASNQVMLVCRWRAPCLVPPCAVFVPALLLRRFHLPAPHAPPTPTSPRDTSRLIGLQHDSCAFDVSKGEQMTAERTRHVLGGKKNQVS